MTSGLVGSLGSTGEATAETARRTALRREKCMTMEIDAIRRDEPSFALARLYTEKHPPSPSTCDQAPILVFMPLPWVTDLSGTITDDRDTLHRPPKLQSLCILAATRASGSRSHLPGYAVSRICASNRVCFYHTAR